MAAPAVNRSGSRHAQRGVAAIFAAISLLTLISALALGIDVGRLYYAQRDLQRLADLAAVDAARVAQGCLGGAADPARALAEAQASLIRNGMPSGTTVAAEMGVRQSVNGVFQFQVAAATDKPDSVQVRLSRPSPARILPLIAGDDTRTLRAQAAALSLPLSSDSFTAGIATADSPDLLNRYFGGRLGGGVNVSLSGYHAVAEARVRVGDIIDKSVGNGSDPLSLPQPPEFIRGLLRQIAEALDATGDGLAATAVRAFADASNNLGDAIPAQLLGISLGTPRAAYENLRVNVGMVLGNVATIASRSGPIILPINLPPPLGDQTITVDPRRIPGSDGANTADSGNSRDDSSDSAVGLGGVVTINLQLIDPALGKPIQIPVVIVVKPAARSLLDLECRRRGLDMPRANYQANGTVGRFSIDTVQDYKSTDINLAVLQALTGLPVGGLLTPLNIAGLTIRIHASAGPVEVGDGSTHSLVMNCPQDASKASNDKSRFDCINSSANIGSTTAQQVIQEAVPELINSVHLDINVLPSAGTPVDLSRVQPLLNTLDASLSAALKNALNLLAAQIIPILNGVNLNVGGSVLVLNSLTDPPPLLYAQ